MSAADDWNWSLPIFDHVDLQTAQYAESVRFYENVLAPLCTRKLFHDEEGKCMRREIQRCGVIALAGRAVGATARL